MAVTINNIAVKNTSQLPVRLRIGSGNEKGSITVNVLELGLPKSAEVALYDRRTRKVVKIKRSDANGTLVFKGINEHREYYLHAIHGDRKFNAVTQDMIPGNYDKLKTKGAL